MNKEELIEGYFSGQLSNEEFLELKTLLEEDAEFRADFHHQLEIQQTIAKEKSAYLKDRFKELDKKTAPKSKWYRYAAVVAAIIGLGIGYIFLNTQPNYQDLYVQNFEVYPNVVAPTLRGELNAEEDKIKSAFALYDQKNYIEAAEKFGELYNDSQEDYAYFYQGVSLMAGGETKKAVLNLEDHQWTAPEKYQTNAHWYLALGYLKLEQKERAILYLEKVANSGAPLANQAEKILKKLN